MHHLSQPRLSPEALQQIWSQLPPTCQTQLAEHLFFLALDHVGGIRRESTPSQPASQDSEQSSPPASGDLCAPVVARAGRDVAGEPTSAVPPDRARRAARLA